MKTIGLGFATPSYFDAGWATTFVALCLTIDVDPRDCAKLLVSESGFNPSAQNSIGCAGLNQICSPSYGIFSSDYSVSDYLNLSVSEQLPYVFAYFKQWLDKYGLSSISARDLYWLNFLPATYVPGSPDSYVISSQGDAYYSSNSSLDMDGNGTITAGDLQAVLDAQPGLHPDLWSYLESQICAAGGCVPSTLATVVGGAVVGFLGYLGWNWWKGRRLLAT